MIVGDLNADFKTRHGHYLKQFVNANSLTIHINSPTRVTETSSTILDQILSNFPQEISDVTIDPPVGSSDHFSTSVKCDFKANRNTTYIRTMWSYSDEAFIRYREALRAHDWACLDIDNIQDACEEFTTELLSVAKQTIPNKQVTVRNNDKPWYNNYLRNLRRKRNRLFNKLKDQTTAINRHIYNESHRYYQHELKRIKNEYEKASYNILANNGVRNSKKWWNLLKSVYSNNISYNGIPPMKDNDRLVSSDYEKAQLFNKHFLSTSKLNDNNCTLPNDPFIHESILNNIIITEQDVNDQLKTLDTNKAFGPDQISPKLLKEAANQLSPVLCTLFNRSLQTSTFPNIWKKANVLPLHKKDGKDDVSNYRPISLLSTVGKVFERVVFKYIFNYLYENNMLSQMQSGFLPGRSTVTQLLEMYDHFCKCLDSKKEQRIVFLDISKAFDRVWFKGLLFKIRKCGIGGSLLSWFSDYLHNRQQRVVINGTHSSWGLIPSGVPQGSVLGPLLFLIYINDITHVIKDCNVRLFADDTCLFMDVTDRERAVQLMNDDLERISKWADQWLVSFSNSKTKSLILSNKTDSNQNPRLTFNNSLIEETNCHSYLGLIFSNNLKWSEHIESISATARKRLNMMLPLKYKLDRKTLQTMYQSFVKPVMEYGISVWGGSYDCDINKLEKINCDGMRLITGAPAGSNSSKLYRDTNLPSIRETYTRAALIMFYKMVNKLTPNNLGRLIPTHNPGSTGYNLRNIGDLHNVHTRLDVHERSFFPRAIKLWNSLPCDIKKSQSLSAFKASLSKHLKKPNFLYSYGERLPSVYHARLRMGCSELNYDLCFNRHVSNNAACRCGARFETAFHYFMECPLYIDLRNRLRNQIEQATSFLLKNILFGDESLELDQNKRIFDAVHSYILDSKRF